MRRASGCYSNGPIDAGFRGAGGRVRDGVLITNVARDALANGDNLTQLAGEERFAAGGPRRRLRTPGFWSASSGSKMPMAYTMALDSPANFKTPEMLRALALSPPSLITISTFFS